jgi:hypothetical protein
MSDYKRTIEEYCRGTIKQIIAGCELQPSDTHCTSRANSRIVRGEGRVPLALQVAFITTISQTLRAAARILNQSNRNAPKIIVSWRTMERDPLHCLRARERERQLFAQLEHVGSLVCGGQCSTLSLVQFKGAVCA